MKRFPAAVTASVLVNVTAVETIPAGDVSSATLVEALNRTTFDPGIAGATR